MCRFHLDHCVLLLVELSVMWPDYCLDKETGKKRECECVRGGCGEEEKYPGGWEGLGRRKGEILNQMRMSISISVRVDLVCLLVVCVSLTLCRQHRHLVTGSTATLARCYVSRWRPSTKPCLCQRQCVPMACWSTTLLPPSLRFLSTIPTVLLEFLLILPGRWGWFFFSCRSFENTGNVHESFLFSRASVSTGVYTDDY